MISRSRLLLALALAASACSGSDTDGASVEAPACGEPSTIVLDGTLDGKPVQQTQKTSVYALNQLADPKQLTVSFSGGTVTLEWASLLANGASTTLSRGALRLPGETVDRTAQSGSVFKGSEETRASLTFPDGRVGMCIRSSAR